ncbi:hypothetical protein HK096_000492, partial [Nowakowskiella sp. JEL0078]
IPAHFKTLEESTIKSFTDEVKTLMKDLGDNIFYTVVLKKKDNSGNFVTISERNVRLCSVQAGGFQEFITIHLDSNDDIFHVDYDFASEKCSNTNLSKKISKKALKPSVNVQRSDGGPKPVLDQLPELRPDGQPQQPPQSWLQKYWYYLIPLAILLLMSGGGDEAK